MSVNAPANQSQPQTATPADPVPVPAMPVRTPEDPRSSLAIKTEIDALSKLLARGGALHDYIAPEVAAGSGGALTDSQGRPVVSRSHARIAFEANASALDFNSPEAKRLAAAEEQAAAAQQRLAFDRSALPAAVARDERAAALAQQEALDRRAREEAQAAQAAGQNAPQEPPKAQTYRVSKGDSLSKIAAVKCPKGTDREAFMAMVYALNADKFPKGHPHFMRAGVSLEIPEPGAVASFAQNEQGKKLKASMHAYLAQAKGNYKALEDDASRAFFASARAGAAAEQPQAQAQPPKPDLGAFRKAKSQSEPESSPAPQGPAQA